MRWTVGLSVMVHVAAGLAFVAVSFWRIDKLKAKEAPVALGAPVSPPPGDPAPAAPRAPQAAVKKPQLKKPDQVVQPTDQVTPPAATEPSDGPDDPGAVTAPGGTGDGCVGCDPAGTGDDPFAPVGPPGTDPFAKPAETPPPPKDQPRLVPQQDLEAQRTSGNEQILLSAATLAQVRDAGKSELRVKAQVCIDEDGVPSSIQFRPGSGFPAVDDTIEAGVRTWRYRAFRVNGRAVPACAIVMFTYRIE